MVSALSMIFAGSCSSDGYRHKLTATLFRPVAMRSLFKESENSFLALQLRIIAAESAGFHIEYHHSGSFLPRWKFLGFLLLSESLFWPLTGERFSTAMEIPPMCKLTSLQHKEETSTFFVILRFLNFFLYRAESLQHSHTGVTSEKNLSSYGV